MQVKATAKFVGTSSRKIGLVAALIRGRRAQDAVVVLQNTPKRATEPVGKVLNSAIANAENNHKLKANTLMVESVLVGPGPSLKRFRPRAQGRAGTILKRSSHITVVLSEAPVKPIKATKTEVAADQTLAEVAKPAATAKPKTVKEAK